MWSKDKQPMKRYPAYKGSGIEWLGEIPEGWNILKLKRVTKFLYGGSLLNENRLEGNVPVYGSNGIAGYHNKAITKSPCIVIGRKGSFGKVNYSEEECFPIDTTFYIDTTATPNNLRWLYYLLLTLRLDSFSKDSAVPGLNREEAYERIITLPPFSEQQAIANYLDRKTRQIDTLIEKKQKQIDLLKEQRTAIINHAVTRGLNPNVKTKDSGIEWLGEIPEHWEVKPLKYTVRINQDSLPEDTDEDREIQYIDIGNVNQDGLLNPPTTMTFGISPSRARRVIKKGDTIISTVRTYLKAIAYIDSEDENLIASTGFAVLTTADQMHSKYLYYLISSQKIIDTISSLSVGVSYPAINSSELGAIPIWFPKSIDEQKDILNFIAGEIDRIRNLINKTAKEIKLLKEYRTALISEVVTGKIDVRDSEKQEDMPS